MKSIGRGAESELGGVENNSVKPAKSCSTSGTEAAAGPKIVTLRMWIAPRLESLGKVEEMTLAEVGGTLKPL